MQASVLGYLDYRVTHEEPGGLGMSNGSTDFWLVGTPSSSKAPIG